MALRPKRSSTVAYREKVFRKKAKKYNGITGIEKPSGKIGSAYKKWDKKSPYARKK